MTRRIDFIWVVLVVAATAIGIWLGTAGADVSPIFTEVPRGLDLGGGRGR